MQQPNPPDPYVTLGVPKDAGGDEIKRAYRRLSKRHHPDKGGDREKFQAVQFAYDVLSDPAKRKQYDETGTVDTSAAGDPMEEARASAAQMVLAMAAAPAGAGTCAHCGNGIRHHVVVRTAEGQTAFIGTECATKLGQRVARCVKAGKTEEQLKALDAQREARDAAWLAAVEAREAELAERAQGLADVLVVLEQEPKGVVETFWQSLARQLRQGPLSPNQGNYVCKAMFGRQNKKNAVAWDELLDRVTA